MPERGARVVVRGNGEQVVINIAPACASAVNRCRRLANRIPVVVLDARDACEQGPLTSEGERDGYEQRILLSFHENDSGSLARLEYPTNKEIEEANTKRYLDRPLRRRRPAFIALSVT